MRRLETADYIPDRPVMQIKRVRGQLRILTLCDELIRIVEPGGIMARNTYNVNTELLDQVLPGALVFDSFVYVYQTAIRILMFVIFQLE
jgi:hypothetical protein